MTIAISISRLTKRFAHYTNINKFVENVKVAKRINPAYHLYKIANLFEDIEILKKVQDVAIKIMNDDPNLTKEKNLELKKQIENKFKDRIEI